MPLRLFNLLKNMAKKKQNLGEEETQVLTSELITQDGEEMIKMVLSDGTEILKVL